MTTNITTAHKEAFTALTFGQYDNFTLVSCFFDGTPAAAIAAVTPEGEGYILAPLFVSVTEAMDLPDHDGRPAAGKGRAP